MKYKLRFKILFITFTLVFFTGCNANYNVEIYNEKVKVNGKILEKDKNKWDEIVKITDSSSFESSVPDDYKYLLEENKKYTYRELIDNQFYSDDTVTYLKGLSKIKNPWQLGLKYNGVYDLYGNSSKAFVMAAGTTYCYDNFNVTTDDETKSVIISTSVNNFCFDKYSNLEEINVKVKTNHKVVSSTADSIDLHTYTWKITKENASKKPLQLVIKSDEYVFNYDNRIVKIIVLVAVVSLVIVISFKIGIIIYRKSDRKKNNI